MERRHSIDSQLIHLEAPRTEDAEETPSEPQITQRPVQRRRSWTMIVAEWLWRKAVTVILPGRELMGIQASDEMGRPHGINIQHDEQHHRPRSQSQSLIARQVGRELREIADSFRAVNGANRRRSQSLVGNQL